MRLIIKSSANRDVKSIPKNIKSEIEIIVHAMMEAQSIQQLPNVKKIKGSDNAYRIRIGDYRMGFFLEGDTITLSRILHRKEIYRYFP